MNGALWYILKHHISRRLFVVCTSPTAGPVTERSRWRPVAGQAPGSDPRRVRRAPGVPRGRAAREPPRPGVAPQPRATAGAGLGASSTRAPNGCILVHTKIEIEMQYVADGERRAEKSPTRVAGASDGARKTHDRPPPRRSPQTCPMDDMSVASHARSSVGKGT